jgi:SHS2 domain-containing protein
MTQRKPWEEIEHTADWALRVWGADLRALFENAARGMVSLIGGEADQQAEPIRRAFRLFAPDVETLLVDWLTELLYLIEEEELVVTHVSVRAVLVTHNAVQAVIGAALRAEVEGKPGGRFTKHIKAATYSSLEVRCAEDGCETSIVFDV